MNNHNLFCRRRVLKGFFFQQIYFHFTTSAIIGLGLAVATFLLNSGFLLQAILLCEECLILLNSGVR